MKIWIVIFNLFLFNNIVFAKLTNQQINLLLENDDVQIFALQSKTVKKSIVSIKSENDSRQGKTITQYDQDGLLINYYSASSISLEGAEKNIMITTLIRDKDYQWQRKQTVGDYQINNSFYLLKDDRIQIKLLPSPRVAEQRLVVQHNTVSDETKELFVSFDYEKPSVLKKLKIEYNFNALGQISWFNFTNIDQHDYGYTSIMETQFKYDELNRLIESDVFLHYQSLEMAGNDMRSHIVYSDFDEYGNWLTKTEMMNGEKIVYTRTIEYWE
ncbi:hypothetical protein [Orbus mooreae]|uniref:hypothetical protein n=1 Tax=Orbus mooreae TaxID=3074107 RepID=UPI00370DDB8D